MMDWPQLAAFVQSAYPGPCVVELGGGAVPWIRPNVDTRPGETVDLVADFNAPLPIASDQFDGIFSKYAAEHVSWRRVDAFFAECHRILKPGGVAVLVLPNTHEQCKLAVEKFDAARWDFNAGGGVSEMLFGGQDYAENAHASLPLRSISTSTTTASSPPAKRSSSWRRSSQASVFPIPSQAWPSLVTRSPANK